MLVGTNFCFLMINRFDHCPPERMAGGTQDLLPTELKGEILHPPQSKSLVRLVKMASPSQNLLKALIAVHIDTRNDDSLIHSAQETAFLEKRRYSAARSTRFRPKKIPVKNTTRKHGPLGQPQKISRVDMILNTRKVNSCREKR